MQTQTKRDLEVRSEPPGTAPVSSLLDEAAAPRHSRKLKILFLAANDPQGKLQVDEEYRGIDHAVVQRRDRLELVAKLAVRRDEIQRGLLQHIPDVVHFGGHGTRAGALLFCGEPGEVTGDGFGALLDALRDRVRLVVLNACFSATQADSIRDSVGIAIGMDSPISDAAAVAFSVAFYEALAYGRSVLQAFQLGRAAIAVHGMPQEAPVPRLLVRRGVDASKVILVAPDEDADGSLDGGSAWQRMLRLAFAAAFLAAVAFAALFGAGVLHQNLLSEYVVFVVLGGLAAIFTWGFLSVPPGVAEARRGVVTRAIGSAATLVAVIGGGLQFAASESEFAVKVKFVDPAGQPAAVTGMARLEIGGYMSPLSMNGSDLVEFGPLPRRLADSPASLTLESLTFRLQSPEQMYRLQPGGMLRVEVTPIVPSKISGTVSFAAARMPGGQVSIVGRDCASTIRDGYFEIACPGTAPPVKVQIRVPENYTDQICTRESVLHAMTDNEIVLERCTGRAPVPRLPPAAARSAPRPPRPCMQTPEALIHREAQLVIQQDVAQLVALFSPGAAIADAQRGESHSPQDRYLAEFARHRFAGASHGEIRCVGIANGKAFYTSSSAGWFSDGTGYNNAGPSDHWILERLGTCWQIAGLIINAAHDGDPRFAQE